MIDPTPLLAAPQPIPRHAIAALAAAALGAFQLWRPKGTRHHRLVGYVWVALMATVAFSGLFIHVLKMFGLFSPINLLSIFTLYSLWSGVSQARRGDIAGHCRTMILLFWLALALTGVFTLLARPDHVSGGVWLILTAMRAGTISDPGLD